MRLGLSSAAAPAASLDALLASCVRRGLAALELRDGDAHGVAGRPAGLGGEEARRRAGAAGVALTGVRSEHADGDAHAARIAAAAGAAVIVGGGTAESRFQRATRLAVSGSATVAVAVGGVPDDEEVGRVVDAGFDVAWDADASAGDLGDAGARLLALAGPWLRHIRIAGGGPEAALQEGRGVGALMARLALAGYDGALILSPGAPAYRVAWETWLGQRGGWGCGSRASDPSLVVLGGGVR